MLLKISPVVMVALGIVVVLSRRAGLIGENLSDVLLFVLIVVATGIGYYRSRRSSRRDDRARSR